MSIHEIAASLNSLPFMNQPALMAERYAAAGVLRLMASSVKVSGDEKAIRFALPIALASGAFIFTADLVVGTVINLFTLFQAPFKSDMSVKFALLALFVRPIALPLLIAGMVIAAPVTAIVALVAYDKITIINQALVAMTEPEALKPA